MNNNHPYASKYPLTPWLLPSSSLPRKNPYVFRYSSAYIWLRRSSSSAFFAMDSTGTNSNLPCAFS